MNTAIPVYIKLLSERSRLTSNELKHAPRKTSRVILRTCPLATQKSRLLGACVQMMCSVALVLLVVREEESGFNLHSAGATCRSRASKGQSAPQLTGVGEMASDISCFFYSFIFSRLVFDREESLVTLSDSRGGRGPSRSTFPNQCQFTSSNSIKCTISATNLWIYTQQPWKKKKDK